MQLNIYATDTDGEERLVPATASVRVELSEDYALIAAETASR